MKLCTATGLVLFLVPALLLAEARTTWTETATLKTKTITAADGQVLYQANYDKATGKLLGRVLDRRPKVSSKAKAGKPTLLPAFRDDSSGTVLVGDTLLKIKILDYLSTRRRPKRRRKNFRNQKGQRFRYQVLSKLSYGGRTVVSAGTKGKGRIKSLTRRGRFGRSGRMNLQFGSIFTAAGDRIPLIISKRAAEYNAKQGYAVGASFGGAVLLGPIGLAGGAFVKGRDLTFPAGSVLWVAVDGDVRLRRERNASANRAGGR